MKRFIGKDTTCHTSTAKPVICYLFFIQWIVSGYASAMAG
jgi:hypothetical protein